MKKVVDGCEAVASIAYKFSELASIYPITPASPMASYVDAARSNGEKNLFSSIPEVIEMQSEAGAAGCLHGALLSGSLATSFTASQGLLLMIPNMYKIAGEGLPGVIHVASRTIASHALSIFGDHSDVYATRQTGFCILSSASVQDAHNLAAVAHLSAIKGSLPFLHFMDGFRTSHEINTIVPLEDEVLAKLLDCEALAEFRKRSLNINHPYSIGMAENEDIYFQSVEARSGDYEKIVGIVDDYMQKINEIQNTDYAPFNYYGSKTAKYIIIAMGSVTSTIKAVVDELIKKGEPVGLVVVRLYRPFSKEYLSAVLPASAKRIAVLDRTKEAGSVGEPLYLDVLGALRDINVEIYGGRYGLASKNTSPKDIYAIFEMLENNPRENFTIGIEDDLNNTSLEPASFALHDKMKEILIYGFGSDGMVSASKDILKIIGQVKDEYVQGYFEYDSKKSGGVTISHLRHDIHPIDAPFYPEHPQIVIVTKDTYLHMFELSAKLSKNGILIVNTTESLNDLPVLPSIQDDILEKNITVFTIDADNLAKKNNLPGKISLIFEAIILKLLGVEDYKSILIDRLSIRFKTKGEDVVAANVRCVKEAVAALRPWKGNFTDNEALEEEFDCVDLINRRLGNTLKTSDLIPYKNGRFKGGLTRFEKRSIAKAVPVWKSEACIECGMCSLVCPHAVIRPFVVESDTEYAQNGIALVGGDDKYKFLISVSESDCTGCGACVQVCPGKNGKKALEMGEPDLRRQRLANTLFNFYHNPKLYDKFTIKGSQMERPLFEFSGACAGCGETPYLKLLTQLFSNRLIIANATGCSSIYGGSVPSTSYSVPWANSLFEDNAEFGYGIMKGYNAQRDKIRAFMENNLYKVGEAVRELFVEWLENMDDYETTHKVKEELESVEMPRELANLLDYIEAPSVWTVGGDGWAYDIGFSGIDHVLSSGEEANILVLDTEVYSNTGGQASKASSKGQVAEFANLGKKTIKKDLFRIAMSYPDVYAASVCLGANMFQTIKAFKEAEAHKGPSIIIAYAPCIEHGIKKGMSCSIEEERLAVASGYTILMRYKDGSLIIDSKEPDFSLYEKFLDGEVRFQALKIKNASLAHQFIEENIEEAKRRYTYYKELQERVSKE